MLLDYANGLLSDVEYLAIDTHLHYCSACADAITKTVATQPACLPPTINRGEKTKSETENFPFEVFYNAPLLPNENMPHSILPGPISGLMSDDYDSSENWHFVSPGVRGQTILSEPDGASAYLLKINPGAVLCEHGHKDTEMIVVLKGSLVDENGALNIGDIQINEPGDVHRPKAGKTEPCLCLVTLNKGVMPTNPIIRFILSALKIA